MKKLLLIDRDDTRRDTRVRMLADAGYDVEAREGYFPPEEAASEGDFDLVIVALRREDLTEAAAYSERLRHVRPSLPILLLTDEGVFVPRGALSPNIKTGDPVALMREIAELLAGSKHIRELDLAA
jgi:DNA-binding NtrC family response regulator